MLTVQRASAPHVEVGRPEKPLPRWRTSDPPEIKFEGASSAEQLGVFKTNRKRLNSEYPIQNGNCDLVAKIAVRRSPSAPAVETDRAHPTFPQLAYGMHGKVHYNPSQMLLWREGGPIGVFVSDFVAGPRARARTSPEEHKHRQSAPDLSTDKMLQCPARNRPGRLPLASPRLLDSGAALVFIRALPPRPPREFSVFRQCEDVSERASAPAQWRPSWWRSFPLRWALRR